MDKGVYDKKYSTKGFNHISWSSIVDEVAEVFLLFACLFLSNYCIQGQRISFHKAWAEQQLVMQHILINRVETIRHFRRLASLTSGQLQKLDRQSRVRESAPHNWLQLADGNVFLIKGKLSLDNSMAYCHTEFIWQRCTKWTHQAPHPCFDNTCEND